MKKWIPVLSGLLIVQLALALGLNLTSEEYGAFEPQKKLLAFDRNSIEGLRIADGERSIELRKRDGKWLLPESGDFPADRNAVGKLLEKLAGLEKGWPVATSSGAAKRFKVGEDVFERKVALLTKDESNPTLYVGSSPGFRKVHVRPEGEDAVYAVAFNTWEANAKADDWIDKEVLNLDEQEVERIDLPGITLQKEGDALVPADLGELEEGDAEAVGAFVSKLTGLRISSLLGTEAKPEFGQDAPELEAKVARRGGEILTYRFSKPKEGDYYVLKRSDMAHYFKVAEFAVKPLLEAGREQLVKAKESEVEADEVEEVKEAG